MAVLYEHRALNIPKRRFLARAVAALVLAAEGAARGASGAPARVAPAVSALLDGLGRCGDTVVQSAAVLGAPGKHGGAAVGRSLGVLACLPRARLPVAAPDEVAAFAAVLQYGEGFVAQVRKTPIWPRSWANSSLF
jgi:hypothetical protein